MPWFEKKKRCFKGSLVKEGREELRRSARFAFFLRQVSCLVCQLCLPHLFVKCFDACAQAWWEGEKPPRYKGTIMFGKGGNS